MQKHLAHIVLSIVGLIVISACTTFHKNTALTRYEPAQGYRFNSLALGEKNTDSLFVVVAK